MGLKPDRWIRQMVAEHRMIDPFVESQVRDGKISFGLSSYGYDLRVADEFKVFTPGVGNLAVVDPKNLDTRAMVDYQGEICIIPPNSFALARTLEYFRMPCNVLGIVLGKSTYARCFAGDTRVALVDGSAPTLESMARRFEAGERFWGYCLNPAGQIAVAPLEAPRYIGRDALLELVLDNGARIQCTPDHLMVAGDGRMVPAHELRPGAALLALSQKVRLGYRMLYYLIQANLHPAYRLFEMCEVYHGGARESGPVYFRPTGDDGADFTGWPQLWERASRSIGAFDAGAAGGEGVRQVVEIRELPGDHDVYCLTVPEAGNFALEAGVFVHNCGIVTNFTPLEPGWEGYITIEISNTTPMPAKIYANEGIAQVLFFEGDEPCETSYADKQGKYQGQTGIVLPRL